MVGTAGTVLEMGWGGEEMEKMQRGPVSVSDKSQTSFLYLVSYPSWSAYKSSKEVLSKKKKIKYIFSHSELQVFSCFNISKIGMCLIIDKAS